MQFFIASKNVYMKKKLGNIIYDINLRGIPKEYLESGKTSPNYIYVTTEAHFREIHSDLESHDYKNVLGVIQEEQIVSNPLFPKNIGGVWKGSLEERLGEKIKSEKVSIAIINAFGTAFGDAIVGLRATEILYERLKNWFKEVKIDLFNRTKVRNFNLYLRNRAVSNFHMLPTTLEKLLEYDFVIDLGGYIEKPELEKMSMIDFFLEYMGIDKDSISPEEKRNRIEIDEIAKLDIEEDINLLKKNGNKLLLFHPLTSTQIRTIPENKSIELIKSIIDNTDYTVVAAVPINFEHERFKNISHLSKTFEHFIYIVSQVDAVITAGTVTYHIADSFNIPTVLLATVKHDKSNARYYPSIKTVLLGENLKNNPIINKHKSLDEKDIEFANLLWKALKPETVIDALNEITKKEIPENINVSIKSKYNELVSIVIPTYNREKYIKDALITAMGQTHKNLEIIVVDDGSTDNTREIVEELVRKDSRIQYIYQENRGADSARNTGIKKASGRFIKLLDSDDLLFSFAIERELNFLMENSDIKLVYTDVVLHDGKVFYYRIIPKTPKKPELFFSFLISYPVITSTVMADREALIDVGMFDETGESPEDYGLLLRFMKKYEIASLNVPSAIYRKHGGTQITKDDKKVQSYMDRAAYKFVSELDIEKVFSHLNKKQLEAYIDSVVNQILKRRKPLIKTSIYLLEFNQKLNYSEKREKLIEQLKEKLKEEVKATE